MKRYSLKVQCKGCQDDIYFQFDAPKSFCERDFPCKCKECESEILIQVRQGMMKKQMRSRVQMIKHSEKLLDILSERRASA